MMLSGGFSTTRPGPRAAAERRVEAGLMTPDAAREYTFRRPPPPRRRAIIWHICWPIDDTHPPRPARFEAIKRCAPDESFSRRCPAVLSRHAYAPPSVLTVSLLVLPLVVTRMPRRAP